MFLSGTEITDSGVYDRKSLEWFSSRSVSLYFLDFDADTTDEDLTATSFAFPKVKSIVFDECTQLSNIAIESVLRKCNQLMYLELLGCAQLTDQTMKLVADHNTSLFQLVLRDLPDITDERTAQTIFRCKSLNVLELENCGQLGDLVVRALGGNSLSDFSFTECAAISEDSLLAFIEKSGKNLRSLRMPENNSVTDRTLHALARYCPLLDVIDVDGCVNIGETGFNAFIKAAQRLTSLSIMGTSLSAAILDNMSSCISTQLTFLCVTDSALSDAHMEKLPSRAILLEQLLIPHTSQLTNNTLISIGKHLPKLTHLTVHACTGFSVTGFIVLAKGCLNLTQLDVASCSGFTNDCLHMIAVFCTFLANLYISNLPQITDSGIQSVAKHCVNLTDINLLGTLASESAVL